MIQQDQPHVDHKTRRSIRLFGLEFEFYTYDGTTRRDLFIISMLGIAAICFSLAFIIWFVTRTVQFGTMLLT